MEQSRERFTLDGVYDAVTTLGFGAENVLHVDYDDDIPDEFVENAWKGCIKRSWRDNDHGAETHRLANDAFRILADHRNSVRLRTLWDSGKNILKGSGQRLGGLGGNTAGLTPGQMAARVS